MQFIKVKPHSRKKKSGKYYTIHLYDSKLGYLRIFGKAKNSRDAREKGEKLAKKFGIPMRMG